MKKEDPDQQRGKDELERNVILPRNGIPEIKIGGEEKSESESDIDRLPRAVAEKELIKLILHAKDDRRRKNKKGKRRKGPDQEIKDRDQDHGGRKPALFKLQTGLL